MMMPGRKFLAGNNYRFGFNGKEEANEVNEGHYDFEARIYDSRIGRFLSKDNLDNEYDTPFGFAGNSPLKYVDFNGYFKISPFFARRYPTLAKILEVVMPALKADNGMMERWINNLGFDDHGEGVKAWNEMLTFGSGPYLTPSRPLNELKNRYDQDLATFFDECESGEWIPKYPDNITVGYCVFDNIEAALKKGDGKELSENIFVAMMKIMHEGGHWARHMKAKKESRNRCYEDGAMAEEAFTEGIRFSNLNCRVADFIGRNFDSDKAKAYYNTEFNKVFGKDGLPSSQGVWLPRTGLCLSIGSFKNKIPQGQPGDQTVIDNGDKEPKIFTPSATNSTGKSSNSKFSYD